MPYSCGDEIRFPYIPTIILNMREDERISQCKLCQKTQAEVRNVRKHPNKKMSTELHRRKVNEDEQVINAGKVATTSKQEYRLK